MGRRGVYWKGVLIQGGGVGGAVIQGFTASASFCQPGSIPPQDSLSQVHKQADLKRALKMYSVVSDGEDGRSRTPSPSENNNEPPYTSLFESTGRYVCILS